MDFIKKAISQGEKVVLAKCQKALIGGTDLLPTSALGRPRWAHVWHWIDDPYISYIIQHEFDSFSPPRPRWHFIIWYEFDLFSPLASLNKLVAACSDIRVNKEMSSIEVNTGHWRTILKKLKTEIAKASDCVNGTWLEDLGVTDYNTITKKYLQHRSAMISDSCSVWLSIASTYKMS